MTAVRRALVTGATGFVGRVMVPALASNGYEVVATGRRAADSVDKLDVTDAEACREVVAAAAPDVVVHLAAMTYLPQVLEQQKNAFSVNVLGSRNLLDAVHGAAPRARTLLVSTCSVYGIPEAEDLPLKEDAPLRAMHPYGVQKIGVEVLGNAYRDRGLDVVVVRPFNHVGPGVDMRLSVAFFAGQIVAAERGEREPIMRVGNLAARRDFTDVRDVVRAYLMLLEHDTPPVLVNVASGRSIPMSGVLEALRERARVDMQIETDPDRMRPLDTPDLAGDASLIASTCGWKPEIPLEDTWDRILAWVRDEPYGDAW
ncbi:MAG: GDP-mannose 4,6-dehydratase [Planctomycetes bacterium]|nr:GDP-mannose 4,6-dehydratase [Planctomycetota bacterium]